MISSAATVIRIAVSSLKISGETDPEVLCKNYISRFQSGSSNTDMQSSVSSPVRGRHVPRIGPKGGGRRFEGALG